MNDDGVALTSIAHPVAPWYRRIWLWFRPPRLSPDSLETIEIDIKDVERRATSDYALLPNYEPTKGGVRIQGGISANDIGGAVKIDEGTSAAGEQGSKPDPVLPIGSPTDLNKIHTYSIDSRPRIVPSESDRITAVWVSDGKLCLVIQPQHALVGAFHPCGPDYTSPDGKWMAPQLMEPINESRKKLGLSEFTGEDFWNMGERNVRLMYYALTDRLPDESDSSHSRDPT